MIWLIPFPNDILDAIMFGATMSGLILPAGNLTKVCERSWNLHKRIIINKIDSICFIFELIEMVLEKQGQYSQPCRIVDMFTQS